MSGHIVGKARWERRRGRSGTVLFLLLLDELLQLLQWPEYALLLLELLCVCVRLRCPAPALCARPDCGGRRTVLTCAVTTT